MKRNWKLVALILGASMVLGACGSDKAAGLPDYMEFEYNYEDYFELGEYKGVTYTPYSTEVTDAEVDEEIDYYLDQKKTTEKTDKTVIEDGDVVHIQFTGYLDGEAFEGGATGEAGTDLEIGSGSFVGTFEEQLIGEKVGTTVTLKDVVFPDDYSLNADLAGKSTTFEVTIEYISKYVYPELNDAFVAGLEIEDVTTVDAFRTYVYDYMKEEKESMKESMDYEAVIAAVMKNCTVKSYPEEAVQVYVDQLVATYESYAEAYGVDLNTLLNAMLGISEAKFREQAEEMSKENVADEMLLTAVVAAEGLDITDEEYEAGVARYAESNGITADEMKSYYEENLLKTSVLLDKAMEFLLENAKVSN